MIPRNPRLLNDQLQEITRLSPVKLTLLEQLIPLSTAEMVLSHDAPETPLRSLVEIYDEHGSAGIFRVKEVTSTIGSTRKVILEHSLCTLRDGVIPGQGFMGSIRECFERLLACQPTPLWAMGDVETPDDTSMIFATEYNDLLSALEIMVGMLPEGYALAFDQSVTPWLMHLRKLTDVPFCEGRLSRNLQSIRIAADASRLCTRVYPFGAEIDHQRLNLLPLSGSDHLESSAAEEYGVISRTFQNDLIFDVPTLQTVAQNYLDRHAGPEVTITVSAADLSAVTGEDLDFFHPGRLCRLCLPEEGLTLTERIITVHKPDICGTPDQVLLTLSNHLKQQTESAEIDEMVRQVTAGKLLGGTVTEVVSTNRAFGSYPSPVVHYFNVEDWAALLDVRVTFTPDTGASVIDLRVDSTHPEDEVWKGRSFSAMPYLKRDELGQVAQGQHHIVYHPSNGTYGENCGVSSTITMTVIEKTTP